MLASRTQQLCLLVALSCIGLMLLSACGFGGTGLPRGVVPDPFVEPGTFVLYTDSSPNETEHLLGFGSFANSTVTNIEVHLTLALPGCSSGQQLAINGSLTLAPIRRLYAFSAAASLDSTPTLRAVHYGFAIPSFQGLLTLSIPCSQHSHLRVHASEQSLPLTTWRGRIPGAQPLKTELFLRSFPDADGSVLVDASLYAANPKSPCGTLAESLVRLPPPTQAPLTVLTLQDSISHFEVSVQGDIAALRAAASPVTLQLSYRGGPCYGQTMPLVLKR